MIRKANKCEICGKKEPVLHKHHIIPRTDPRSTNKNENLALICPNCHTRVHLGEIIIIGLYKSTAGFNLVWFKKNEKPPFPEEFWLVKDNPLVITLKGGKK